MANDLGIKISLRFQLVESLVLSVEDHQEHLKPAKFWQIDSFFEEAPPSLAQGGFPFRDLLDETRLSDFGGVHSFFDLYFVNFDVIYIIKCDVINGK